MLARHTLTVLCFWSSVATAIGNAQSTTRVSLGPSGIEGNQASFTPSISASGSVMVFSSDASNLVSGDLNSMTDVFVYDSTTSAVTRVSVDSFGAEANGASITSLAQSISGNGECVAFWSSANDLVAGDTNGVFDIFVNDRATGITERVSVDSSGGEASLDCTECSISEDGNAVAFVSASANLVNGDTNGAYDVFIHDRATGVTERVSVDSSGAEANGSSSQPCLSGDGRFVVFSSSATNLVIGDKNGAIDVFIRDRQLGTTERISVSAAGKGGNGDSERPFVTRDGRFVAFQSKATNLVSGDTNSFLDVFVRDVVLASTSRVSIDSSGGEANGDSSWPTMSPDGTFVAFSSKASNLVGSDQNGVEDAFSHRLSSGETVRISVDSAGNESNGSSGGFVAVSDFGSLFAFGSAASNLVSSDTNGVADVFQYDRCGVTATWINYGSGLGGTLGVPSISALQMPVLGGVVTVYVGNSRGAPTIGVLVVGDQRGSFHTKYGADLLVTPAFIIPISFSFGGNQFTGTLSSNADYCGATIDIQALEVDSGAPLGVSFSDGLELQLGR